MRGAAPPGTGEHTQQKSPRVPTSLCAPGSPGTGQWPLPVAVPGWHNVPAGRGLPCGVEGGGVPAATMQQPQRKSRHMDTLGCPFLLLLILSPTAPSVHARVGGGSPAGFLLLQPGLCPLWAWGDTSSSPVQGLSCRSRASIASFFGKPRHAKVETWPVCKQAPGPRGFLYKGCFSESFISRFGALGPSHVLRLWAFFSLPSRQ